MTLKTCSWLALAVAALPVLTHADAGHSLEADQHDERMENQHARKAASERVTWRDERWRRDPVVRVKLLGINDFHGQLSGRFVGSRPAGGAAVLASYLEAASAAAEDGALIIHAGDHVGASPPNSALLQDEPAITVLNTLANEHCRRVRRADAAERHATSRCNVIGTLGNHEFDEGLDEALRLIEGGNHPKGPFLESPWRGARFPYVSANVVDAHSGKTVLPPYVIRQLDHGVRIGVIGAVLKETPSIVTPTGVAGLRFLDEATASIGTCASCSIAASKQSSSRSIKARGRRATRGRPIPRVRMSRVRSPTSCDSWTMKWTW